MKRYFVTSDIHSFFSIFKEELESKGFDIDNKEHILIICGDLFDRGSEAKELLNYLLDIPKDRLILIMGNHEDLMSDLFGQMIRHSRIDNHHFTNKTIDTIAQFNNITEYDILNGHYNFDSIAENLKPYSKLVENMVDFKEIGKYIFTHGWLPIKEIKGKYFLADDWKHADEYQWQDARWLNGIEMAMNHKALEPNKTIVCGHFNSSYGNFKYHNKGSGEFTKDADFEPFEDNGIIALDACTAFSKKINIIVIDEE